MHQQCSACRCAVLRLRPTRSNRNCCKHLKAGSRLSGVLLDPQFDVLGSASEEANLTILLQFCQDRRSDPGSGGHCDAPQGSSFRAAATAAAGLTKWHLQRPAQHHKLPCRGLLFDPGHAHVSAICPQGSEGVIHGSHSSSCFSKT